MRKILSTTIIVTTVFYASISAAKPLPGLTNEQTGYLICASDCLKSFKFCTGKFLPFIQIYEFDSIRRLRPTPLRTFFGCLTKKDACIDKCRK